MDVIERLARMSSSPEQGYPVDLAIALLSGNSEAIIH